MQGRAATKLIYQAAIKAVSPVALIPQNLKLTDKQLIIASHHIELDNIDRIFLLGAGKASAAMAASAEEILGDRINKGFVVTSYGNRQALRKTELLEAGHPLPDHNSLLATQKIKAIAAAAGERDLIIFLLSGGASALMADYPEGSSLADLQEVFKRLLISGATIQEMNTVRKQLSAIKGGKLAQLAFPAQLFTLTISDVIDNDPSFIGSGPTAPDNTSVEDMLDVLEKYHLNKSLPASIQQYINQLSQKPLAGLPKIAFDKTHYDIIADNNLALQAAAKKADELGYQAIILTEQLQGEARTAGQLFSVQLKGYPRNTCLLKGGETTVTVKGKGIGGRNQELALSALLNLPGNATILAAGTDGIDGPTTAAGAFADASVRKAAEGLHLNINSFLEDNDSWHFFEQTDSLFITGPTDTNVMDIVIGLVE